MEELAFLKEMTPGGWGIWTLVAVVLISLLKIWPTLKKLQMESDGSLRTDLLKRIAELEKSAAEERADCVRRLKEQDIRIDGLTRQLITLQLLSGHPISPPEQTPVTNEMMLRLLELHGVKPANEEKDNGTA